MSSEEILGTFNEHFVSIGEKLAGEIPPSVDLSLYYLSKIKKAKAKFHFKKIHWNQVHRLLYKLKTGKASGRIRIYSKNILPKSPCDILNASIERKIFLQDFKKIDKVTPIFKVGLTDDLRSRATVSLFHKLDVTDSRQ